MNHTFQALLKSNQDAQEAMNQANYALMAGEPDKAGTAITRALSHLGTMEAILSELLPKTD